ncbi:hypothetical protein XENOCAPTIV_010115 [Xenoophorus captivus]|uniref:Periplakin n=1 Tax=Xenoophorus captivus TaxID=1517983 RepID=A0ABV0SEE1_9TELE
MSKIELLEATEKSVGPPEMYEYHCELKNFRNKERELEIDDIKQNLRLKQTEEEDHQKRISNTRRTIEDLKSELAKISDQPDVTPQINAVNVELRRIQVERAKIEEEKADLRRESDNITAESKSQISITDPYFTLYNQKINYRNISKCRTINNPYIEYYVFIFAYF